MIKIMLSLLSMLLVLCGGAVNAAPLQVRTMSQAGYPAKYDLTNPAKPGICLEIIRAIERVDPEIKFNGLEIKASTSRMVDYLVHGDIDVYFGLLKTPQRLSTVDFIDPPLFSMQQVLIVRRGDPIQVDSWDAIRKLGRNGVVLSVADSGQSAFLKAQPGLHLDSSAYTVMANVKKLLAERGRFIFVSENNVRKTLEEMGATDQVTVLRPAFLKPDTLHLAFSRRVSPEMVSRIVEAIKLLERSGEMNRIRKRYDVSK